jgi:hypothetical protein
VGFCARILVSNAQLWSVVVAVFDRGGRVHLLHGGLVTLYHGDLVLNADVPKGGDIKLMSGDPTETFAKGVDRVFILRTVGLVVTVFSNLSCGPLPIRSANKNKIHCDRDMRQPKHLLRKSYTRNL